MLKYTFELLALQNHEGPLYGKIILSLDALDAKKKKKSAVWNVPFLKNINGKKRQK